MEPLGARNPRVRAVRRRARQGRDRSDRRAFVVEGPVLVADAVSAGAEILELYATSAGVAALSELATGIDPVLVSEEAIEVMATTITPQPVIAVVAMPRDDLDTVLAGEGPVIALDAVQDPGNAGTILRSAEASGAAGVVFGPGSVDRFAPKVVRSSAGSILRLPTAAVADLGAVLDEARATGRPTLATAMDAGTDYDAVDLTRACIVLGNEAHGVSPLVRTAAAGSIAIPQAGTESLNVAMAATILCFEAARQRRGAP